MSEVADILDEYFGPLIDRITELETRLERMFRKGKCTDVDPENHLYRQEIGVDSDGNPVKSPWRPYSQIAGGRKSHSMPSVGQPMVLVSPDGDHEQGIGWPGGWSDGNPSPSNDPNADVDVRGQSKDTTTEDAREIMVGKSGLKITDGLITFHGIVKFED